MNQKDIGSFIKTLRVGKKLTQAELAEIMGVSDKTVSRRERGSNMPDIGMVIELAEFYDVSIKEILKGKKGGENMDKDAKETAIIVADYENSEKKKLLKLQQVFAWAGLIGIIAHLFLNISALDLSPAGEAASGFFLGVAGGCLLLIIVFGSRHISKIAAFKKKITAKMK